LAKEAGTDVLHEYIASPTITITQPGYVYIYLSNESMQPPNASPIPIEVYFDDFKVTHTKTPVVQSNDHFAHGMDNSALSYQRENSVKNNFLYNAGSEVQGSIDQNIYDMPYRGMDVSIGRMMQVDPMADTYSSHTTYNYAFNDPVFFNDPNGADPNSDGWNQIQESRNYDMERNYYNTHGIYGDDDMYGSMFGRAGTLGYDYSTATPTSSWQDHLAGIFGTGNVDTYVNRGYWLSSDQTINTGPLQFVMPLNSQLGELTVRGIRDRWMDRWVKVGGQQQLQTQSDDLGKGVNFSLFAMYAWFQLGGGKDLTINARSLDFSNTSQKELGLDKLKVGQTLDPVNLFNTGINPKSLAFGRLSMTKVSDTEFSIAPNRFDFDYQSNASWQRNLGTVIGGMVNYNIGVSGVSPLIPIIYGGPYNVIFNGTVTIPK
jgi:RHS repeat-associated protein